MLVTLIVDRCQAKKNKMTKYKKRLYYTYFTKLYTLLYINITLLYIKITLNKHYIKIK